MSGRRKMYAAAGGPLPTSVSNIDRKVVDSNKRPLRVYHVWKGNNRFCCGGRVMFGPDARSLFLTAFLILAPVVLFCTFISEGLIREFGLRNGIMIVAISIAITALIVILLLLTSGSDPGIIPRNEHPPEPDDDTDCSNVSVIWPGSRSGPPMLPPTKDATVNGIVVKVKYCQTCMLYRPPRCSHCSICNNCVERFDHHCPWVGQCIGKRNYRFFFMFILLTTLLCLYVFAFCWVNISWMMHSFDYGLGKALMRSPISGILILYTFIAAWFVGGLTAFHFYLILSNQTTYENCRYRYDGKMNPHNRGCARNFAEVLLSKIPASKNNFREKINMYQSSEYNPSMSLGHSTNSLTPKVSYDVESGKRQAVAVEDLEEIRSQIDSVRGLERCSIEPPHANWDKSENWEINPDIKGLAAELGMQYGAPDGQKPHEEP
ncbi:hypothetical protein MLD38_009451 [Melastoma candidum]|uniref:Uncharacterized protein n=1 Tax=Melastoma candidum TaxID=119954 RepID=A0ACB9RXK7_9MYRT|nr:hypothetical protein MLD38_009451 [Melastoma candidum]